MASTDKPDDPETGKAPASEPTAPTPAPPPPPFDDYAKADVALRVILFAATLTSLVVMVTSDQIPSPQVPGTPLPAPPVSANFNQYPAFIYFVAAITVACFYSIITTLASVSVILNPSFATQFTLYFAFLDTVMLGVVASATGTAGAIAYTGLNGNSFVGWNPICNVSDTFCRHAGSSIAVSLFASVLLLVLSHLSISSLFRKIRD